jgi:hypothetical protein
MRTYIVGITLKATNELELIHSCSLSLSLSLSPSLSLSLSPSLSL